MSEAATRELERALAALRAGGCVAYPTETVWGLAVCAADPAALDALFVWKGREEGKPMAVLVSAPERLESLGMHPSAPVARLLERFWPGPLTVILPAASGLAPGIANARGGVGVRCSPHPTARALAEAAEACGLAPLTATSLNRSGEPPARTRAEARALLAEPSPASPPTLLGSAGPDAGGAAPSTVLDLSGDRPSLLREGSIERAVLASALAELGLALAPAEDDSGTRPPNPEPVACPASSASERAPSGASES